MAYDKYLADRIRISLDRKAVLYDEIKMMGGLAFMVDEKMCVGIIKNDLMARVGPEQYQNATQKEGCREMTFTGRPLKGFVLVKQEVLDSDDQLSYWVGLCLAYNPFAKKSRKKRKK